MKDLQKPTLEPDVFIAEGAICMGNVTVGKGSSIWYHATVRADRECIHIGNYTNIQDNSVIHVDEGFPVCIGDYVTIGHGAILHGCEIGDNTLVGMGAILLNGARIGKGCIIGAGALVTQNMEVPDDTLLLGSPARAVRETTGTEREKNHQNAEAYYREAREESGK